MEKRITVRIPDGMPNKMEARIKKEYPKLKNFSDLVREALTEFLKDD
jgi:Arc/MetJ-type ribon-helix-helix transcriptional regulator